MAKATSPALVTRALREQVIEAASQYTLAEIAKLYRSEGFALAPDFYPAE